MVLRIIVTFILLMPMASCITPIEQRDLPKCSGHDRRPLNSDLWNWSKDDPKVIPAPTSENTTEDLKNRENTRIDNDLFDRSNKMAFSSEQSFIQKTRWNIAASHMKCGPET